MSSYSRATSVESTSEILDWGLEEGDSDFFYAASNGGRDFKNISDISLANKNFVIIDTRPYDIYLIDKVEFSYHIDEVDWLKWEHSQLIPVFFHGGYVDEWGRPIIPAGGNYAYWAVRAVTIKIAKYAQGDWYDNHAQNWNLACPAIFCTSSISDLRAAIKRSINSIHYTGEDDRPEVPLFDPDKPTFEIRAITEVQDVPNYLLWEIVKISGTCDATESITFSTKIDMQIASISNPADQNFQFPDWSWEAKIGGEWVDVTIDTDGYLVATVPGCVERVEFRAHSCPESLTVTTDFGLGLYNIGIPNTHDEMTGYWLPLSIPIQDKKEEFLHVRYDIIAAPIASSQLPSISGVLSCNDFVKGSEDAYADGWTIEVLDGGGITFNGDNFTVPDNIRIYVNGSLEFDQDISDKWSFSYSNTTGSTASINIRVNEEGFIAGTGFEFTVTCDDVALVEDNNDYEVVLFVFRPDGSLVHRSKSYDLDQSYIDEWDGWSGYFNDDATYELALKTTVISKFELDDLVLANELSINEKLTGPIVGITLEHGEENFIVMPLVFDPDGNEMPQGKYKIAAKWETAIDCDFQTTLVVPWLMHALNANLGDEVIAPMYVETDPTFNVKTFDMKYANSDGINTGAEIVIDEFDDLYGIEQDWINWDQ